MNSTLFESHGKSAVVFSLVNNVLDKCPKRCTLDQAVELLRSDHLRASVETSLPAAAGPKPPTCGPTSMRS